VALALAAKGSGDASILVLSAALAFLWLSYLALAPAAAGPSVSGAGFCVAAFALWIVGTNLFVSSSYTAIAQYHAAFLFGGYLYGRRTSPRLEMAYRTLLALGIALSAWGFWQVLAEGEPRAHGPLIAPATFAAVLNLVILPGAVLLAAGTRRPWLAAALGLVALAVVVSTSRGAWLALAGAGGCGLLLLHRAGRAIRWTKASAAASLLLVLIAGAWALSQMQRPTGSGGFTGGWEGFGSLQPRLELFRLAVGETRSTDLVSGAGYDTFYYALERGRGAVPTYAEGFTHFVHNDYLQTLYELGLPGLTALLLAIALPLARAWRRIPHLPATEQTTAIAALSTVSAMALQALVDFPFYIPICLLIFGAALGVLDATFDSASPARVRPPSFALARRVLSAAAGTLAAWVLITPAVAEAASLRGAERLRNSDGQGAAFWFEAARRIDPRDWRYHWYAGQFWMSQAETTTDPVQAALADAALVRAIEANPRQPRPLSTRIALHDRLRGLLENPADGETMRAWAEQLVALAPTEAGVRAERDRIFKRFPPGDRK